MRPFLFSRRGGSRLASLALLPALLLDAPRAVAAVSIPEIHRSRPDVDGRVGKVEPSAAQIALAESLGAAVRWSAFGTPRSLVNHDGFLATGLGPDPAQAARSFLAANSALFRLSAADVAALELYRNARLAGGDAHAVMFRQRFGGLPAAEGGLVTVGVANGNVAYVSSSLTGDDALSGTARLSATEAWRRAAADVGRTVSALDIGATKAAGEWTAFGVSGFAQAQRARLVAAPTPQDGVRAAYHTLFVDVQGGSATAFSHLIDAETGAVLLRRNIVYQSHPAEPQVFEGAVPQTNGACDAAQGPWVVSAGEDVRSIDVAAEAVLTVNDMVLILRKDGVAVATQDTLFSPEALHYEPQGGVPPGSYTVQVCDYSGGAGWDAPNTYSGQIFFNPTGARIPFPPKWQVFPASPPFGASTDTRERWCWDSTPQGIAEPDCERDIANLASRSAWDLNVRADAPTFSTLGNNASAAEAWTSPLTPGLFGQRPFAPDRRYLFPWDDRWRQSRCDPAASGLGVAAGNDIFAATTNLFAMHNRMHDWSYFLGFTEENFNAQDSNFGNAGAGGDPLLGDAQAGAVDGGFPSYLGRDNANMIPLPDGVPPITNMYLWQPLRGAFYTSCVDGDYDMSVIAHEYGHLIESRQIGKGGFRAGFHAGAMGESHADLMAVEYLNANGFVPQGGENPFAVGPYAAGNLHRAIRNYGMNTSPLNFSNIGYDPACSTDDFGACETLGQVHADGEIWSAVNFDIREALIAKYNGSFPASNLALQRDCAEGARSAAECPGNRRWIQLVFDSYLLMPADATMVDARDAQLAADRLRFAGANQAELWLAFSRRGFGRDAFAADSGDVDPRPDFASPRHGNARITFSAVAADEGNLAVQNATIYVGAYEARVSPIGDTDPTTNAGAPGPNNLDEVADFAPGTYTLLVQAPGYGHAQVTLTARAGQVRTLVLPLRTNWASSAKGGSATGDGVRHAALIDDTERTNWERTAATPNVGGTQVTVRLARELSVRRINVSALLRGELGQPTQNRFTGLRSFRIEVSTDGLTYTPVLSSAADAFPGAPPRPVAPDLRLRTFTLPAAVPARFVRLVVTHNQCTGQPQFQGVQDNDPLNATDCRTGVEVAPPGSFAARDRDVRITELQVFSR